MREIKFRAWDKEHKEMIPWEEAMFPEWLIDADLEVMQFTGLMDKHKKEIYEGDVLKLWDDTHKEFYNVAVEWDHGGFRISGSLHYTPIFPYSEYGEIIGNIHKNPDLLK